MKEGSADLGAHVKFVNKPNDGVHNPAYQNEVRYLKWCCELISQSFSLRSASNQARV